MKLAHRLKVSLAVEIALGLGLAWLALPPGAAPWLFVLPGVALPAVLTAGSLASQMTVDALLDPRQPRTTFTHALRVWLVETSVSLRVFCFRQLFRADFPEPAIERDPGRRAVLLIHGFVCNRAVWRPLLASGALAGCNVATIDLTPVHASIDEYAEALHAAIDRLRTASAAARVVLICHSMGGLAARSYLRRYGHAAVERVVTIGTPHAGTWFARFGVGRNARQMQPGNAWLRELDTALTPELRARFVCIACRDDNLILPRASAVLAGARNAWVDGVGHLSATEDPRVWSIAVDALQSPPAVLPAADPGMLGQTAATTN